MKPRNSFLSIVFWSVIAAAFIGPGTVTTAAKAGAAYGTQLLWALTFSIIATIVLQEAAARITIASGKSLGEIIGIKYKRSKTIQWGLFLVIAFGCAAYQAGNLLGAISGLSLIWAIPTYLLLLLVGLIAEALLWSGNVNRITGVLGLIVATMGIAFLYVAFHTDFSAQTIASGAFIPSLPNDGQGILLVIGLIGTTIVPYNLFLGSGISKGQSLSQMRRGLIPAILIGGIISIAIVLVGAQVAPPFSFQNLATSLNQQIGSGAGTFFGIGLFIAGLTSAITAPLAAAITASSLLGHDNPKWQPGTLRFRLVWNSILIIGLTFGLLDIQPIPAIILAQAINGLLLPIVAIFLLLIVNDRSLLHQHTNRWPTNILMGAITLLALFLGGYYLWSAWGKVF
jgi:manganese transport protein